MKEKENGIKSCAAFESEKILHSLGSTLAPEVTNSARDVPETNLSSTIPPVGGESPRLRKSVSMDATPTTESEIPKRPFSSLKRRSVRRRSSKRFERPEPTYGLKTADYEAIRDRVLEERAVVNAIEALQERWRMLMFMYEDCVELNEGRKDRRFRKLCVKRQYELIIIVSLFVLMCIPTSVFLLFLCKLT